MNPFAAAIVPAGNAGTSSNSPCNSALAAAQQDLGNITGSSQSQNHNGLAPPPATNAASNDEAPVESEARIAEREMEQWHQRHEQPVRWGPEHDYLRIGAQVIFDMIEGQLRALSHRVLMKQFLTSGSEINPGVVAAATARWGNDMAAYKAEKEANAE
jgi:hypothetical protein